MRKHCLRFPTSRQCIVMGVATQRSPCSAVLGMESLDRWEAEIADSSVERVGIETNRAAVLLQERLDTGALGGAGIVEVELGLAHR